jgi:hypothetical protein
VLGADAALIGAAVAGKANLGHHWWWPIVGLGVSALFCVGTFVAGRIFGAGPNPGDFYATYGGLSAAEANAILLKDLADALQRLSLTRKEIAWSVAFYALIASGVLAASLFA